MTEYSETDIIALGHHLRQVIFGAELNEDEQFEASCAILKIREVNIIERAWDIGLLKSKLARIELNSKTAFISKDGWVTKFIYDYTSSFYDGVSIVGIGDKQGYLDRTGKECFGGLIYRFVSLFREGFACVSLDCDKYFFINKKGVNVFGLYFSVANSFEQGLAVIGSHNHLQHCKYGYIDRKGRIAIPRIYDIAWDFNRNNRAIVKKDGKYGVIDKQNNTKIELKYDYIESHRKNFIVSIDQKYGVVNRNGKVIIPIIYSDIKAAFCLDYVLVLKNGLWGVMDIDHKGKIETICPCIYDSIEEFKYYDTYTTKAMLNGVNGRLSISGNWQEGEE